MKIIAHRGLPETIDGPGSNSYVEYERALKNGMDIEMDVRFHGRYLLCSHDPIMYENDCITFQDFCYLVSRYPNDSKVFVNVKCDGASPQILKHALEYKIRDRVVTFDHSMPDFLLAEMTKIPLARAARCSAYEQPHFLREASDEDPRWIWVDPIALPTTSMLGFLDETLDALHGMDPETKLVVVSPDVHLKKATTVQYMNDIVAWATMRQDMIYGILTDQPVQFGIV